MSGRKDGARSLITLDAHAAQASAGEQAQKLEARLSGWEFEIPDYKYAAIFTPLTDLLKPLPPAAKKPSPRPPPTPKTPGPSEATYSGTQLSDDFERAALGSLKLASHSSVPSA